MKTKVMMMTVLVCMLAQGTLLTSCSKDEQLAVKPTPKEYFTLWNQCEALTT